MNKRYLLKVFIAVLVIVIGVQLYQTLTKEPYYTKAWGMENIYDQLTPAELHIIIEEIESVWELLYAAFLLQLIQSDFEEPESDDVLNQLKSSMHELEALSEELYRIMLFKMNENEPEILTPKHNI